MKRQFKITDRYTPRTTRASQAYISELNRYSLLTLDEEVSYAQKAREGDEHAMKKLVEGNLRFVVTVAKTYTSNPVIFEELIQAGNIGLVKAAQRFDETRGFKFISYAIWWIRQGIMDYLGRNTRTVQLTPSRSAVAYKIYECGVRFEGINERAPNDKEMYDYFTIQYPNYSHISFEVFKDIRKADQKASSLDAELSADTEDTLLSLLPAEDEISSHHDHEDNRSRVKEILNMLEGRERYVIERYYGLDGDEPENFEGLAEFYGIGAERVRQIYKKAIHRIRGKLVVKKGMEPPTWDILKRIELMNNS